MSSRNCKTCGHPLRGHGLPKGKLCQKTPVSQTQLCEQERIRAEKNRERAREGMKSEENQTKTRERLRSEENQTNDRKRKRSTKNERCSKQAWTTPGTVNPVIALSLPSMNEVCIDCGAKMFPWELSKPKEGGKTFSKCCSYGTIKLHSFTDPSPKLKELFIK